MSTPATGSPTEGGTARYIHDVVARELELARPVMDQRLRESLAWAVAGAMLSHSAALPRIALSYPGTATADSRLRRVQRLLDGVYWPSGVYMQLLRPHLAPWRNRPAFVIIDTTSLSGRIWFVRIALRYRRHSIPLAWRVYQFGGATVAFSTIEPLLDCVADLLPPICQPPLVADRGFLCGSLVAWCRRRGWDFLLRAKRSTGFRWADNPYSPVYTLREVPPAPRSCRAIHDALLSGRAECPLHFLLSWPSALPSGPQFVACGHIPSTRTPIDYLGQIGIEHAFRDDKSAGFRIESNRILDHRRLNALLLIIGWATVHFVALGDRTRRDRRLSQVQSGSRALQRAMWHGLPPDLSIAVAPDRPPQHWHDPAFLARRLAHIGLESPPCADAAAPARS